MTSIQCQIPSIRSRCKTRKISKDSNNSCDHTIFLDSVSTYFANFASMIDDLYFTFIEKFMLSTDIISNDEDDCSQLDDIEIIRDRDLLKFLANGINLENVYNYFVDFTLNLTEKKILTINKKSQFYDFFSETYKKTNMSYVHKFLKLVQTKKNLDMNVFNIKQQEFKLLAETKLSQLHESDYSTHDDYEKACNDCIDELCERGESLNRMNQTMFDLIDDMYDDIVNRSVYERFVQNWASQSFIKKWIERKDVTLTVETIDIKDLKALCRLVRYAITRYYLNQKRDISAKMKNALCDLGNELVQICELNGYNYYHCIVSEMYTESRWNDRFVDHNEYYFCYAYKIMPSIDTILKLNDNTINCSNWHINGKHDKWLLEFLSRLTFVSPLHNHDDIQYNLDYCLTSMSKFLNVKNERFNFHELLRKMRNET